MFLTAKLKVEKVVFVYSSILEEEERNYSRSLVLVHLQTYLLRTFVWMVNVTDEGNGYTNEDRNVAWSHRNGLFSRSFLQKILLKLGISLSKY